MAHRVVRANEMWYNWAQEFPAGERERRNRQELEGAKGGSAEETEGEVTPSYGLVQGDLVYIKRRASNKPDTEYKGP